MNENELAEACRRAAKQIREHPESWMQNAMSEYEAGRLLRGCLLGHVRHQLTSKMQLSNWWLRSVNRAHREVGSHDGFSYPWMWNDVDGREATEVTDRLDRIADYLEFGDG